VKKNPNFCECPKCCAGLIVSGVREEHTDIPRSARTDSEGDIDLSTGHGADAYADEGAEMDEDTDVAVPTGPARPIIPSERRNPDTNAVATNKPASAAGSNRSMHSSTREVNPIITNEHHSQRMFHVTAHGPEVTCPQCAYEFCFYHSDAHPGKTCEEFARRLSKREVEAMEATEQLVNSTTKPCPYCNSATEKNGGCNHMYVFA
jgi:ribosomal protein S10